MIATYVCNLCPATEDAFYTSDRAEFVAHVQVQHFIQAPLGKPPTHRCPKCGMEGDKKYNGLCSWCWLEKYRE